MVDYDSYRRVYDCCSEPIGTTVDIDSMAVEYMCYVTVGVWRVTVTSKYVIVTVQFVRQRGV